MEAEAVKNYKRIGEIFKEMEKSCPIPMVGEDRTHYFSIAGYGENQCVSRFHVMGHIIGDDGE